MPKYAKVMMMYKIVMMNIAPPPMTDRICNELAKRCWKKIKIMKNNSSKQGKSPVIHLIFVRIVAGEQPTK